MLDPRTLYEVHQDAWGLMRDHRPVLIVQLDGFIDAGQAGRLLSAHLLEHLEHRDLVEFDLDQLHDYRSRRPMMQYDGDHWSSFGEQRLVIHRLVDTQGEAFLLLHGPEPDVQWQRTSTALLELIEQLDVRLVVSLTGIPGAVPHTRPVALNAHATDPDLVRDEQAWFGKAEVQASFAALLEYRLGEAGRTAIGFEAFVPHYLAQAAFPQAALMLTQRLAQTTGLALPIEPLERAAATNMAEIVEEVAGSTEAQEMVGQLEEQYDSIRADRGGMGFPRPTAEDLSSVPSADEIGAAFERFLAEREDPDDLDQDDDLDQEDDPEQDGEPDQDGEPGDRGHEPQDPGDEPTDKE